MTPSCRTDPRAEVDEIIFETSNNLKPHQFQAGYLTSKDQKKLRYAIVPSHPQHSRGTVVLLQGRNECIEKYYETIDDLNMRGLHVATMDWRGQGYSDRLLKDKNRGFVHRFNDYIDDLKQFIHSIVLHECPPPYYILAHSVGGLVTLTALPHLIPYIERIVLAAPLLGIPESKLSEKNLRWLSGLITYSGFGKIYAKRGVRPGHERKFLGNRLTSDETRFKRNQQIINDYPKLGLAGPTFTWLFNALSAIHHLNRHENLASQKIPTLFILAGGDTIVSNKAAQDYARKIRSAFFITIDGARHELLQEDDYYREQFWAAFDAFIPDRKHKPIMSQDNTQ